MNRRNVLQLGGNSILFLGSGCLGWFQNTVRLCQIDIDITSTINSLQLRLSEREETIYEETYNIDSSDEPTNRVAIDDSDIPVSDGEFTLHGRVDGHGWKEWFCLSLPMVQIPFPFHSALKEADQNSGLSIART